MTLTDTSSKMIHTSHTRIKRYSISYVIRELQPKTAMRSHYTPIGMAKILNTENTNENKFFK